MTDPKFNTMNDCFIDLEHHIKLLLETHRDNQDVYQYSRMILRDLLCDVIAQSLTEKKKQTGKAISFTVDDVIDIIYDNNQHIISQRAFLPYIDFNIKHIHEDVSAVLTLNTDQHNKCIIAIIGVLISCIGLCLAPLGIEATEARTIANTLLRNAGQETLCGFESDIANIANAETAFSQAKAVGSLFMKILTVFSINAFITAIWKSLPWYRWVIVGASAVAQLIVWLATDGLGLVAQLALMTLGLASVIESAIEAGESCSTCKGERTYLP